MAKRIVERMERGIDYDPREPLITVGDMRDVARAYEEFFKKRQVRGSLDNRTDVPRERPVTVSLESACFR